MLDLLLDFLLVFSKRVHFEEFASCSFENWFVLTGWSVNFRYDFNSGVGSISDGVLDGYWYSLPAAGECHGSDRPADGSGCTWRVTRVIKIINSTCAGRRVDAAIESHAAACFNACAPSDRNNPTTECYSLCYANAVNGNVALAH